jgi:hypothetical protein
MKTVWVLQSCDDEGDWIDREVACVFAKKPGYKTLIESTNMEVETAECLAAGNGKVIIASDADERSWELYEMELQ